MSSHPANRQLCPDIIERIRCYGVRSHLSRLLMEVVARTLCSDQIKFIRNEFGKMHVNESGEILMDEFRSHLLLANIPEGEVEAILACYVVTRNEKGAFIQYHDFVSSVLTENEVKEECLRAAFNMISKDHHHISILEVRDLLGAEASLEEASQLLPASHRASGSIDYTAVIP